MLLNPRTPLIVGTILVTILGGMLAMYSPMPARLSGTHGQIADLHKAENCQSCHHPDGLAEGCMSCHGEIREQLAQNKGYHHFLLEEEEPRCTPCHVEHFGEGFSIVSERSWGAQVPRAFKHPHIEQFLTGAHDSVDCEGCHIKQLEKPLTLPAFPTTPRDNTFLGLGQECLACHEDIHAQGSSWSCDSCHGQESFNPAVLFDHSQFFALTGPHANRVCADCHHLPPPKAARDFASFLHEVKNAVTPFASLVPEEVPDETPPPPYPFDNAKGETCSDCHQAPHHLFKDNCDSCHEGHEPEWLAALDAVTPIQHIRTGFRLAGPHAELDCAACHSREDAYHERYQDPAQPDYLRKNDTCRGCHEDIHEGQFAGRYDRCLDCHEDHQFVPTAFGMEAHAKKYPLTGLHAAIACSSCHVAPHEDAARVFVGTSHLCRECHTTPHGEQFAERIEKSDCTVCHESDASTFAITPFDHEKQTGFRLNGAHQAAGCKACHVEKDMKVDGVIASIRAYENTPSRCASCHKDPHSGQFEVHNNNDCTYCHESEWTWAEISFDHNKQSQFPLLGAHADADCSRCHVEVDTADGGSMIHYRPMGRECRDCHEIPDPTPILTDR